MQSDSSQNEILTDSGTNELEVLIFKVGNGRFGINVAKVREIVVPPEITSCPEQHAALLGITDLRGQIIPVISLHAFLGISKEEQEESNKHNNQRVAIVTEFNQLLSAFLVDGVEQIYRVSWDSIELPPEVIDGHQAPLTGILRQKENQLVPMIDFESIRNMIGESTFDTDEKEKDPEEEHLIDRSSRIIYIVEDSGFVRQTVKGLFDRSGYGCCEAYTNGADAWEALMVAAESGRKPDCVITDIEMPHMDGLTLTRQMRDNDILRQVPVILFSSIITEDLRHRGESVGADDQVTKPQLKTLLERADYWINEYEKRFTPGHKAA